MAGSAGLITRREALRRATLLLGGAISAPTLAAVLAGCERRPALAGVWSPRVLTSEQNEMVMVISEHILPETDTPGARAVRVNEFVDEMLASYYPEEERNLFLTGLDGVDERSRQAHGERFLDCTPEQQLAILTGLDRETFAQRPPRPPAEPPQVDVRRQLDEGGGPLPPGVDADTIRWIHGEVRQQRRPEVPFFRNMKELTLVGYYTSEIGATQELRHEPAPGRYEGCIPFTQVGRTWAV